MDGTLITVALPRVGRSLGVSPHGQALVLSIYFLAYALMLWPGGRLVDRLGSRNVGLVGLGIFAAAAGGGALAGGFGVLVASRAVQGIGAGLVSPAALAGAVSGFPAERRGMALGIWGAGSGMANLLGPLLGGALTVLLGWRADWWALVPLALGSALALRRFGPVGHGEAHERTTGSVMNGVVLAATLVATLTFAVMIGAFFLAEQYLQQTAGYSPLSAAAALVVVAVLVALAAPLAGRLADARGERLPAVAGFALAGVALAVLAIPGVPLNGLASLPLLLPVGLGLGLLFVPTSRAALNSAPMGGHGRISAALSAGRLLGAAAGAGLAGLALSSGAGATQVHHALAVAAGLCLLVGIPAATRLVSSDAPSRSTAAEGEPGQLAGEVGEKAATGGIA